MKLVLSVVFIISLLFANSASCASLSKDNLPANTPTNSSAMNLNSMMQLRPLYQQWMSSYSSLNIDEQQRLLDSLKDYPLYPYAELQFLQSNIKTIPIDVAIGFVQNNRDFPLTTSFAQSFLDELTRRQDWTALLTFVENSSLNLGNLTINCRYQYARLMQKPSRQQEESVFANVEDLWLTGKELPSACDPLLDAWNKSGKKTADKILLRIGLATDQNNLNLARHLVNQLPADYKTTKISLLALFDNPRKLGDFSKMIIASTFTKQIVLATFPRLAKADVAAAEKLLPLLVTQQNFSSDEKKGLEKSLVSNYFGDSVTDEQKALRDSFIANNSFQYVDLVEKRIRLAIDENDHDGIAYWLDKLPPKDQQKDEWQYWQANVFLNKNNTDEANAILNKLAGRRGFYGMISAQKLNQPYQLDNQSQPLSLSEQTALQNNYANLPVMQRIVELRYLGLLSESNREWRYYIGNNSTSNYLDLARYAYGQGWGDLAIQATISGKLWDNWTERLPVMYQDLYQAALTDKTIPLAYALAISRQESALDTTVQSPVGASGLMQLMPATAKEIAKKIGLMGYYSSVQLFDPKTNIQLGTYYLNSVYEQNDNNRILASAAYNAGPNRVKRWLKASDGQLDAVAFIESIPFTETRNYVKNVLMYAYIYQLFLDKTKPTGILTQSELDRHY